MLKICSVACVVGWAAFVVFGYFAIASINDAAWMPVTGTVLSFAGLMVGVWAWMRIARGKCV
ncbi:protein-S-isoprenylcysteine O-methyltransferase Ste14 [Rhodovulum iodosum]|uniref:Protein-S-isoprenylcysteine O-methyltransferase Ste14 n=1 Tax=Rhodovulum iodosum TaxID=68291 RepID=A0ABV3XSX6_9RHOB|nr:hypothetical protein [Rhodovulum robiginosum]RSK30610.1 hypothetical protein EJA01_17750 [Rhodovulum robiginosum]